MMVNTNELNIRKGQDKREEILAFIISYIERHSYPPTVREIAKAVELKSTASVQHHLERMLEEGCIETDADSGLARAIRVPGMRLVKD